MPSNNYCRRPDCGGLMVANYDDTFCHLCGRSAQMPILARTAERVGRGPKLQGSRSYGGR